MDLKIAARRANVRYELTRIAIGKGRPKVFDDEFLLNLLKKQIFDGTGLLISLYVLI